MPCRDSGLSHDTRNIMDTSGNVFERLPAREGPPSALFENSWYLASTSHGLRDLVSQETVPEREMRREPQNSSIPVPRFQRGPGILNHTGGTYYSHNGMMEHPRFPIPEIFENS